MECNKFPPSQITHPEVYIIESLSLEDEKSERFDGYILYQMLKLQGKNPIYRRIRTGLELNKFAKEFRQSAYRYLHISCHGSFESVELTFTCLSYDTFVSQFDSMLNNRRIFVSACELGNMNLADKLFSKNGGMYSLIGTNRLISFDTAAIFWSSFYYCMFSIDSSYMKRGYFTALMLPLCGLFGVEIAHYYKSNNKIQEVIYNDKSCAPNYAAAILGKSLP